MNPYGAQLFRVPPGLPAAHMQTYAVSAPLRTHWRPATCEEADCQQFMHGWETAVDERTELGQRQAHYIRHDRSRSCTEARREDGLTVFTYAPGQTCFQASEHRVQNGRPERFFKLGGDWRGNPLGTPARELRVDQWTDDFGEHQERLADRIKEG